MAAEADLRLTTPVLPAAMCSPAQPCDPPWTLARFIAQTTASPELTTLGLLSTPL